MVRFIRDFMLKGNAIDVFRKIKEKRKYHDGHVCVEDKMLNDHFYQKIRIHRQTNFPNIIRSAIPTELIESLTNIYEESIFDPRDNKIHWTITPVDGDLYILYGSTRFIHIADDYCKVVIIFHLEWKDIKKYVSIAMIPILESHAPDVYIRDIRECYSRLIQ